MKKHTVELERISDINHFCKSLSFISEDIEKYELLNTEVVIYFPDSSDCDYLKEQVENLVSSKCSDTDDECIYKNEKVNKQYHTVLDNSNTCINFGNGLIGFNSIAVKLFKYFDNKFRDLAIELGAQEKIYPVLLPIEAYIKTGYLKNSPQYSIFCCQPQEDMTVMKELLIEVENENTKKCLNEPQYALSPSACFHVYLENENKQIENETTYTFLQSVFRNEGRFNFDEVGRLRDYHVREIVFIGTLDYVNALRTKAIDKTIRLLEELNLSGDIKSASDPFIIPEMQKYKKIQKIEKTKYELQLNYNENNKLSVASFNLHGTAFSSPFNFKVSDCYQTVTGCVGFGIERWVIAFLSQYGEDIETWSENIKSEMEKL